MKTRWKKYGEGMKTRWKKCGEGMKTRWKKCIFVSLNESDYAEKED